MSPRAAPLLAAAVLGAVALVRADQTIPAPVKNSDLIVRIEPVGQMPSPDNPTSPAIVGGHLFLIEQTGIIYDWDGATATEVLGPSNYPAGLNPVGREAILNAAADASGSKFYVVFIASDPPDGIPTWTTPRADPDAWEVVYQYDLSGTAIANPTPILALQIRSAGHTGGGLVCLADGSILLAVGDNGDAFQDGLVYPDDPTNHLGKILRIDPTGGSWQVVARGVRNIQRLVVDGTGDAARLNFVDIGGYIAEELDTIAVPDLIANGPANHFGWGEHAGDGHAREGTFFIDPGGMSLGSIPLPDPGFTPPVAEFGRESAQFIAVTGPITTAASFSRITALFGDLVSGTVYATKSPLTTTGQDVFRVNLVDADGAPLTLSGLAGNARPDPRFFTFPDGSAGVLLERTGAFYRLTELPATTLAAAPAALVFGATKNGAGGSLADVTPPQPVTVEFTGPTPSWTAEADQPWIQIANGAGEGSSPFTVSIADPDNTIGGATSLSGHITVSAPGAIPALLTVSLNVQQTTGASAPAFGQIDTPTQNASGVQGAFALTGWALDDIGVAAVQVYRTCFGFDDPLNCQDIDGDEVVYIGDGHFVAGARPDVEASYPGYPDNDRAGWGLLVLSNFLPHVPDGQLYGGQGALRLFVYAIDVEGHRTLLGRATNDHTPTTVTLDNDDIAQPFGNLDTPGQGASAAGVVPVFGWAITPDSDTVQGNGDVEIPNDGSTLVVFVDGAPAGTLSYDQCRGTVGNPPPPGVFCDDDVANAFGNAAPAPAFTPRTGNPTRFRNLDAGRGAIGAWLLDTTGLTNGQHTIVLQASDSAARVNGIGSRFFVVANGGGLALDEDAIAEVRRAPARSRGPVSRLDAWPLSGRPVSVRTGFDVRSVATPLGRTPSGRRSVTLPVAGRLELGFAAPVAQGFLVAGGELRDLPIGSHLDAGTGLFTWAPPPGYFGTYRLSFVVGGSRVDVDVTVR